MHWEIFATSLNYFNHVVIGYHLLMNAFNTVLLLVCLRIAIRYVRKKRGRIDHAALPTCAVPPLTLIKVAYCEAGSIVESIQSLLDLNYPDYELVVIHDGSKDDTLKKLVEAFELKCQDCIYRRILPTLGSIRGFYVNPQFPRLIVVDKDHSGKADSLNVGINVAHNPYFCAVDVDTLLERDALLHLVRPILQDPDRIVASSGIIRIANGCTVRNGQVVEVKLPVDALSMFQIVDQIRCMLFGQIGWTILHCLWGSFTSVSLCQKKAVLKVGGYDNRSVRPDTDLLTRLQGLVLERVRHAQIVMIMDQVAWARSPRQFRALAKRRRHWHQGLMETLLAHFQAFGHLKYGVSKLLILPAYTIMKLLGPIVEIVGYLTVGLGWILGIWTGQGVAWFIFLVFFYGTFLSVSSILLEQITYQRYPNWSQFFRLFLYAAMENFGYRQMNSWWRLQAVVQFVFGCRKQEGSKQEKRNINISRIQHASLIWVSSLMMMSTIYTFFYFENSSNSYSQGSIVQWLSLSYASTPQENSLQREAALSPGRKDPKGSTGADPVTLKAHHALAKKLAESGNPQAAVSEYEKLVALNPQNRDLKTEYAWALMQASLFDRAVAVYDSLLKEDPDAIDLRLRKAMALYGVRDYRSALEEYKEVLRRDPSNLEAQIGLQEVQQTIPRTFDLVTGILLLIIIIVVLISSVILTYLARCSARGKAMRTIARSREERFIHFVAVVSLAVATYYIIWRLTNTMNWDAWWFSIPVFAAELYGVLVAYMFFFMVWNPTHQTSPPPIPRKTVDVFITTYNENLSLLRMTVLGCLSITYPHKTYVLDDGNRPEVARLALELGCEYIAREKNTNAKAGNLNNALRQTSGEFIVTFDADHVPLPHFVDRLLGYFRDEKVAFVQVPQDFYNIDSFQHRVDIEHRKMWTEQSLFFSVIQPGKDYWNSAFYCGSCAILRRSALEDIGGIAEETVTEDIHTAILLHAKGYKSVYHKESLAYGVAAETALPFHVQRLRWGQGAMQVFMRCNPLWMKGLTFPQRISYLASMTTYFDGFQKLIYYTAPVVYLMTGILPIKAFDLVFLMHFIPYFVLFLLSFELMSRGCGSTWFTEQYNMAKFATFIKTSLGLFVKKRLGFRVTPKARAQQKNFKLLLPQMIILCLSLSGMAIGTLRYFFRSDLEPLAYWGNLFWAIWNTGLAWVVIGFSLRKVQLRSSYRFLYLLPCRYSSPGDVPGSVQTGLVRECHEAGASLITLQPLHTGTWIHLSMNIGEHVVSSEGIVVHSTHMTKNGVGLFRQGIRFTKIDQEDQNYLTRCAFELSIPRVMRTYGRFPTVFDWLEQYLAYNQRGQKRWKLSVLTTLRYSTEGITQETIAVTDDISKGGLSVMCSDALCLGMMVNFTVGLGDQQIQGEGEVLRTENLCSGDFKMYRYVIRFPQVSKPASEGYERLNLLFHLARTYRS